MTTTITQPGWLAVLIPAADVADEARRVMRMDPADPDAYRVEAAATATLELVEGYLDRDDDPIGPPAPNALRVACVNTTVEMYRRKDAPFGVLDSWSTSSEFGPVRIGTDWLKGVEYLIDPYRNSFGIG